jgi:hypothetical protein
MLTVDSSDVASISIIGLDLLTVLRGAESSLIDPFRIVYFAFGRYLALIHS